MNGIFFPQRVPLRIDGGSASPAVLEKKVLAVAYAPSYATGELVLRKIAGIELTGRGLNKTAVKIGSEMVAQRERANRGILQATAAATTRRAEDGDRLGVRQCRRRAHADACGRGRPGGALSALAGKQERPVFADEKRLLRPRSAPRLARLFRQSGADAEVVVGRAGNTPATAAEEAVSSAGIAAEHLENDWRPQRLFRTCLSSLEDSDAFGRLMEVEADARGFYHAAKKAFVSDGLPYNWTIQSRHFSDFTPILDFVHAVEHLYEAARSVHDDAERRWTDYLRWAGDCWRGTSCR